jgi:hypothetical protein
MLGMVKTLKIFDGLRKVYKKKEKKKELHVSRLRVISPIRAKFLQSTIRDSDALSVYFPVYRIRMRCGINRTIIILKVKELGFAE